MQMLSGKIVSKALTLVANLGVCDHMKETPTPIADIAAAVGADPDALYRVLRALAAVGVFAEAEGRAFAITPISAVLRSDAPQSLRAMARWINERSHDVAWMDLEHSVRTGKPGFDKAFGVPVFDYFGQHAELAKVFDEAMGSFTTAVGEAVARAYDFSDVEHLVDVGGSQGVLLASVLARFPKVRTTLFDLPQVVERAKPVLDAGPFKGRIEAVGGDFLAGVPAGADAYVMKSIIHDWSDAHCVTLLANCRKAMRAGGRVLIVEGIVSSLPQSIPTKLLDLEMLVMTHGGRERTEGEFAALLQKAELKLTKVVPTESGMAVIEAHAA